MIDKGVESTNDPWRNFANWHKKNGGKIRHGFKDFLENNKDYKDYGM